MVTSMNAKEFITQHNLQKWLDKNCGELSVTTEDVGMHIKVSFKFYHSIMIHKNMPIGFIKHELLDILYKQIGYLTTLAESLRREV